VRRQHILKANEGSEYPSAAIWFDTETKPERQPDGSDKHRLWFGWLAYSRRLRGDVWSRAKWRRFEDAAEFWDIVENLRGGKTCLYMLCHNAAFDFPVVHGFTELTGRGWTLTKAVIDSPPVILAWRKGNRSVKVIDTLNIWRMPLVKIGEQFELFKLDMPLPDASLEEWDIYCRRDVEVIHRALLAWLDFLQRHDLGGFAPTLAGQALRAFRHKYMRHEILLDAHERALELSREALHGGRVECFRLGAIDGPLHQLDFNSMYPAVMRDRPMPHKLIGHYRRVTPNELERWTLDRAIVGLCDVTTDEPVYGVVRNGRLIFPVGKFRAALTTPEIAYGLRRGHIARVHEVALYESAVIFRDFVEGLYAIRMEARSRGDKVTDMQAKTLMNSLFGKWGQRGRVYEIVGESDPNEIRVWREIDADSGQVFNLRSFGGVVQQMSNEGEARESLPAISAHITAEARLRLWEAIRTAGAGHVFYTDTDSVLVDDTGRDRLAHMIDAAMLGALKVEASYADAEIRGPKDYRFGAVSKTKGVRKSATWLDASTVRQERFSTLVGLTRAGDLDAPVVEPVVKRLRRVYTKGEVEGSGDVRPFRLAEW
jgi:hypothetical protein